MSEKALPLVFEFSTGSTFTSGLPTVVNGTGTLTKAHQAFPIQHADGIAV